jgi:hypothetical protein
MKPPPTCPSAMSIASRRPVDLAADARAVRRRLAEAGNHQVLQVLQLVESLPDRGDADRFLALVRDRLRALRPARKMRLARLLFQPLDLLIVSPKDWRPGAPLIPRTAVMPLVSSVSTSVGRAAEVFERVIGALSSTDAGQLQRVGVELWPLAARALEEAAMPASWTTQGLPSAAFVPLRNAVSFLLATEARLAELRQSADRRESTEHHLRALLAAANQRGAACWGMLLVLLLQRFPEAEAPLHAAMSRRPDQTGIQVGEAALDQASAWIEKTAALRDPSGLAQASDEIASQIALLDRLAAEPSQRRRATYLSAALQAGCIARFQAGLHHCIASRLDASLDEESIGAMEQAARDLRRLETEARRLGGGAAYDEALRNIANRILVTPHWGKMERVRLIEIFAGTPLALQSMRALAD